MREKLTLTVGQGLLLAVVSILFAGPSATAGTVNLGLNVIGAFDPGTFAPVAIPNLGSNNSSPVVLQLGVMVSPTPEAGVDRDFLNLSADFDLGGLVDVGGGYTATPSPQVDINPNPIVTNNQPVFATNQDAGSDSLDLKGIIFSKTAPLTSTDPRTTFAGYPIEMGQVYLLWSGGPDTLTISGSFGFNSAAGTQQPSVPYSQVFQFGAAGPVASGDPTAGDISGLLQGAFDTRGSSSSPAILPIMIMDGAVQSFDLVVDQPELASFVQVEALAEVGKYNLILSGPFETLDPGTILSGSLSFVTDNGNVDYTFSVNVPEPSTVALTGLAMVGLVGFLRRKSS